MFFPIETWRQLAWIHFWRKETLQFGTEWACSSHAGISYQTYCDQLQKGSLGAGCTYAFCDGEGSCETTRSCLCLMFATGLIRAMTVNATHGRSVKDRQRKIPIKTSRKRYVRSKTTEDRQLEQFSGAQEHHLHQNKTQESRHNAHARQDRHEQIRQIADVFAEIYEEPLHINDDDIRPRRQSQTTAAHDDALHDAENRRSHQSTQENQSFRHERRQHKDDPTAEESKKTLVASVQPSHQAKRGTHPTRRSK